MDDLGIFNILLIVLLTFSLILNIIQLKKIRTLSKELKEVGTRVSVTKEELAQIRRRLEKMKSEL
ncbi:MAG: hypothetical protein DSO00_03600 [Archaeoglobi archaeon]|jgi:hypothetical protein|nr:MAG: hypothetical protein DSN99_08355 [Archaeoglobi archaeon]TDA29658.1 MAG: hypothetical protein DSO00_03600 [Archaeoglobi archaeon]